MLFLPLLILSIILYMIGNRISSVLVFFFFLFDGFQLIPEFLFDTHIGISKSIDFAFIYIFILFLFGLIKYDDYIPVNAISKLIAIYLSFIIICIGVSFLYYHISIVDIIRTSRSYFLVLSYFVLRRLNKLESDKLLKILFFIVLFQCCLFIIQAFSGIALLTGGESGRSGIITRFYNTPLMLYFLVFYAIFSNPYRGWLKIITTVIPSITMFLPLHRSLMMVFIVCLLIGVYIKIGGIKKIMRYLPFVLILILPILLVVVKNAGGSRTVTDLSNVMNGEFIDIDDDFIMDDESTFMFRMAHFFERYMDVTETKMGFVFGRGFMTEDSDYTNKYFDYQIGLTDEKTNRTIQLDTSDISWSNFIIRYGVVGTMFFLLFYFRFLILFIKERIKIIGLICILYMLLIFLTSYTSDLLYTIYVLIFPLFLYDKLFEENISEKYVHKEEILLNKLSNFKKEY